MPPTISQMMMPMIEPPVGNCDQLTRTAVNPSCNCVTGACA